MKVVDRKAEHSKIVTARSPAQLSFAVGNMRRVDESAGREERTEKQERERKKKREGERRKNA